MSRLSAFLLCTFITLTYALNLRADDCRWWQVPSCYMPGTCLLTIPDDAPCEKGKEKFSVFIARFNSDTEFRISRIKTDASTCMMPDDSMLRLTLMATDLSGLFPLEGIVEPSEAAQGEAVAERFAYWYAPQRDSIVFNTCCSSPDEPDYKAVILHFRRLKEKWYCTDAYPWGEVEEAIMQ